MEIGFSLGSNMGMRKRLLAQAKTLLLSAPRTHFVDQSAIYETVPVDVKPEYEDQSFLNAVLIVESELPLESWLSYMGKIEKNLGRVRTEDRNAPRPIDIDMIYAGDEVVDSQALAVPHPRWSERRFVVEPLCEVRPELMIPDAHQTVRDVLASLPDAEGVGLYEETW